jgi:hypothetical protein
MVVMIDLENFAAYEKYREKLMADAEEKEIVEFAKNPAVSWRRRVGANEEMTQFR